MAVLLSGTVPRLNAQAFGFIPPGPGLQVDSISVNSSYSLLPSPGSAQISNSSAARDWDAHAGISVGASWTKAFEHGDLSARYTGGYGRRVRYSDIWDMYHTGHLTYTYSKAVAPRITFGVNANARVTDFESYFLTPAGTSATIPAASPIGTTQVSTVVPNGAASQSDATLAALYGGRVVAGNLSSSVSFAHSERLTYNLSLNLSHSRNIGSNSNTTNQAFGSVGGLLSQGSYGSADFSASYALTPRTTLGVSAVMGKSLSRFGHFYTTSSQLHLGRTMTPWWRVSVFAGAGFNGPLQASTYANPQPIGGFQTNLTGYAQSLSLMVHASADDIYAIGAHRTLNGTVIWVYHPPSVRWSFFVNGSAYRTSSTGNGSFNTWSGSAGTNKVLTDHLFLGISAHYASYNGLLLNNLALASGIGLGSTFDNQAYRGAQVSLSWSPGGLKW